MTRYILLKSGFIIADITLFVWMFSTRFPFGLLLSLDTGAARVCHTMFDGVSLRCRFCYVERDDCFQPFMNQPT